MTDYARFKKAFCHWQKELGLVAYTVTFKLDNLRDSFACIDANPYDKTVTVSYDKRQNGERPDLVAFHECLHLLLAEFAWLAKDRHSTIDQIDIAEESIVRTLENVLYARIK